MNRRRLRSTNKRPPTNNSGTFQDHTREPGLTALLFIQVSLIFMVMPLSGMGVLPRPVVPVMFVLLVIAVLVVTSRSYVVSALVLVAVVLTPFGAFVRADHPSLFTELLSAGGRLLGLVALSWVIVGAVFAAGRVSVHRIQGAVVLYLNFALFFFVLYRLLDTLTSHAFTGLPPPGTEERHGDGAALFQLHHAEPPRAMATSRQCIRWRAISRTSDRHRSALSGNAAGAACQPRLEHGGNGR